MKAKNREDWLAAALTAMRPAFKKEGVPLPERIRATVGFPSVRAMSAKNARIGECWNPSCSADDTHELMISPRLSDAMEVFSTLLHEACHAACGTECGHKGPFVKLARGLLLEGRPTATFAGDAFKKHWGPVVLKLGPLPHAALSGRGPIKKQSTRLQKCMCSKCGYTCRVTNKWLNEGAPICPICHRQMEN